MDVKGTEGLLLALGAVAAVGVAAEVKRRRGGSRATFWQAHAAGQVGLVGQQDEQLRLIGEKISRAIRHYRESAYEDNRKADDIEAAWSDHDWDWMVEVGVISDSDWKLLRALSGIREV